jgi:hypothetical protein
MHPANKIVNLRRRVNRARQFPDNTCAASRHVHMMANALLRGETWWFTEPTEREHVAGSLLAVLEALWKARTEIARSKWNVEADRPERSGRAPS